MPTNEQRRETAKRKLERQLENRAERERKRRQYTIIGSAVGAVLVVAAVVVGIAFRWRIGTWLLALLASIVPLGSVIFLIWADRTGRMGHPAGSNPAGVTAGAGSEQPRRAAPETT